MKFMTRELHNAELTDEEFEARYKAFAKYNKKLMFQIPMYLWPLLTISFHDGLIISALVDTKRSKISMKFRCGNLQIGYFDLSINYLGVNLSKSMIKDLKKVVVNRNTDILDVELAIEDNNEYRHSYLFGPRYECSFVFKEISYTLKNAKNRDFISPPMKYRRI